MLFLIFVTSNGLADTLLVFDDGSRVMIRQGSVLFGDEENGFLYPGTGDAMTAIDWRDKTYMVIDKEFTSSLSDQMDAAMAQMEAQLAQLPPEQRAMMREMLKDKMPATVGYCTTAAQLSRDRQDPRDRRFQMQRGPGAAQRPARA